MDYFFSCGRKDKNAKRNLESKHIKNETKKNPISAKKN
jgi:hypothetical protein